MVGTRRDLRLAGTRAAASSGGELLAGASRGRARSVIAGGPLRRRGGQRRRRRSPDAHQRLVEQARPASRPGSAAAGRRARPGRRWPCAIATYDGSVAGAVSAMSARWARTVSTSPRTIGPVSAASPWASALSRAAVEQRAQRGGGVVGAGGGQQLHRLADQGDEVVGAVRETRVVERALALGHPHRDAAEVGDQGLGELALAVAGGHAEHAAGEPVEVELGAGEGHRRVHRDRAGADARWPGSSTARPWRPEVWHDDLALADRAGADERGDDVLEHVVGDGQQQQVAGARDVGRLGVRGRRAAASRCGAARRRTRRRRPRSRGRRRGARRPGRRRHDRRRQPRFGPSELIAFRSSPEVGTGLLNDSCTTSVRAARGGREWFEMVTSVTRVRAAQRHLATHVRFTR